jgi:pimeloyl-ACP methyl ester carboxylesterase
MVFVDQRGTGGSNNVTCSGVLFAQLTSESQIPQATQSCLEEFAGKADPQYYTTAIAVDDFDHVRQALGYGKIDIYGVSYGVTSGLAYVQRHGDHVRAAVFDSGSLLDVRLWQSNVVAQQNAMNRLFAQCHVDAACRAALPSPESDFQAVIARLSRAPVELDVVDPTTGKFVQLDVVGFLGAVADHYLGSTPARALLLRDIHRAAAGDWTAFSQLAASQGGISDVQMMALTVKCSDEWAALDQKAIAAHASDSAFTPLVLGQAETMNLMCSAWPKAEGVRGRVQSSAPIVFLNGTFDPNDPPENVAGAETDMPNSLVVPVQGTGHWQLAWDTTGCLAEEAATFLALGQRPALSQFPCASTVPMPAFVLS